MGPSRGTREIQIDRTIDRSLLIAINHKIHISRNLSPIKKQLLGNRARDRKKYNDEIEFFLHWIRFTSSDQYIKRFVFRVTFSCHHSYQISLFLYFSLTILLSIYLLFSFSSFFLSISFFPLLICFDLARTSFL